MRASPLRMALAVCVVFLGCKYIYGPKEEVKAFINEKEDLIFAMGKKVEADPTPAGVDAARALFEAKKGDLLAKQKAIYQAPHGRNSDWLTMLLDSSVNDYKYFDMIRARLIEKTTDSDTLDKFRALENDFFAAMKGS